MADIRDIVAEQSYQGSSNLGGGTSGVLQIDVQPVQELARFAMFRNKALFDQRQKDIDAKVGELAEFTALNLNGTRGKDRDYLLGKWDEVQKASEEYARYTPKDQRDKVEKKLEYDKKLAQLKFDVTSANKRAIAYGTRVNSINNSPDSPEVKAKRLGDLNKEFDSTEIFTPIRAEDTYSVIVPELPKAPVMEFDVMEKQPNGVLINSYDNFDAQKAGALAFSFLNNLEVEPLPANATDAQRREYDARQAAYKKGGASLYTQGVEALNTALNAPKYKDSAGNVDYNAIKASNKLAGSVLSLIDSWNTYATDKVKKIDAGVYADKSGNAAFLNKDDYLPIDKTKPTSPEQLIKAAMWLLSKSDSNKKKYQETDDAIQAGKLAIDREELALKRKQLEAKTGKTQEELLAEMGNALDSFGDSVETASGNFTINKETGQFVNNDGTAYSGNVRIAGQDVPDGIRNLILQAHPSYFSKDSDGNIQNDKPATINVKDGQVQSIKFDGINPIDRKTIENYQINEVSKFIEKGNPFLPTYGAKTTSEFPVVTSQAEYNKLKSGQVFIENGVKYKKP